MEVEYRQSCNDLGCSLDLQPVLMAPGVPGSRCEMVRVTVAGHQDADGGVVKFHLFKSDNFLESEPIATVAISIIGKPMQAQQCMLPKWKAKCSYVCGRAAANCVRLSAGGISNWSLW